MLDTGSYALRVGFAHEDAPADVLMRVGRPKGRSLLRGGDIGEVFIGQNAETHRAVCKVTSPLAGGAVVRWDDLTLLYDYALRTVLSVEADLDGTPVALADAPFRSRDERARLAQLFFERYQAPALLLARPAQLAAYERSTGASALVVDLGAGTSVVSPVYEHEVVAGAVQRMGVGVDAVLAELDRLCMGRNTRLPLQSDALRCSIVAQHLAVAASAADAVEAEASADGVTANTTITLPDGVRYDIGTELQRCTELYFSPAARGLDTVSLVEACRAAVRGFDAPLRSEVLGNVVLCGGGALVNGMAARLRSELAATPEGRGERIRVSASLQPQHAAWRGGALLARQDTFSRLCYSREMYDEHGFGRLAAMFG